MSGDKRFERKHVLLFALLAVAIVAIPGRMAWSMRSDAQAEANATRTEVRDLEDRIAQARRDQRDSAKLNEQLKALAAALPPDADLASVVEQLATLAKEANVTWKTSSQNQPVAQKETTATTATTVTTGADGTGTGAGATRSADAVASEGDDQTTDTTATAASQSYLVDIDLEGTTANLTTFLEKLRSLPRLFTVERMTWSWRDGATGGSNSEIVVAHMTLKAYTWSGAPKALPDTTTTVAGASTAP